MFNLFLLNMDAYSSGMIKKIISPRKPALNKLKAILRWSKRYGPWYRDGSVKIIFIDETNIELHFNKRFSRMVVGMTHIKLQALWVM